MVLPTCAAADVVWLRPGAGAGGAIWGTSNGIAFAIHPGGFGRGEGGPRGLIRAGYPIVPDGRHALVNFIAIEPVVHGKRGYSEMEKGADGRPGLVIGSLASEGEERAEAPPPGMLVKEADGAERLDVRLRVEPFHNGARVELKLSIRSDAPDELRIEAGAAPGSAPMERCILTATMGNFIRARRLWLGGGFVECRTLYPGHEGDKFAPHTAFPVDRLLRAPDGGVLAAITTDEAEPAAVFPFQGTHRWHYPGPPVTQYWRKERGSIDDGLVAVVNARATYWATQQPIPGGAAFENFELSEPFRPRQAVIFGMTRRTPRELGFPDRDAGVPVVPGSRAGAAPAPGARKTRSNRIGGVQR